VRSHWLFLSLALVLLSSGCSLTMNLTGFTGEEDVATGSIQPAQKSPFPIPLDDEDMRRLNSALSLAVDPQGAGLPVNWDNPATRRRGTFSPIGELALVGSTICRPFRAVLVDGADPRLAKESRHEGQACRTGPGEWAIRDVKAIAQPGQGIAPLPAAQGLPHAASSMLPAKSR
jgi:surface antigen